MVTVLYRQGKLIRAGRGADKLFFCLWPPHLLRVPKGLGEQAVGNLLVAAPYGAKQVVGWQPLS